MSDKETGAMEGNISGYVDMAPNVSHLRVLVQNSPPPVTDMIGPGGSRVEKPLYFLFLQPNFKPRVLVFKLCR